jgi:hypothetical protein
VGLTPALFEAMAEVWEALARTPLAAESPESITADPDLVAVLGGLSEGFDGKAKGNDDKGVNR